MNELMGKIREVRELNTQTEADEIVNLLNTHMWICFGAYFKYGQLVLIFGRISQAN